MIREAVPAGLLSFTFCLFTFAFRFGSPFRRALVYTARACPHCLNLKLSGTARAHESTCGRPRAPFELTGRILAGRRGAAEVSRAPASPPFEMFSRAAAAAGRGVCDAEERAPSAPAGCEGREWIRRKARACCRARMYSRARRRRAGASGHPRQARRAAAVDGGRSFRVNSSERFRGEEAEAPPRPSGTRKRCRPGRPCAHTRPRGDRAAMRLTTLSPETRPAEKCQPERLRAEHARTCAGSPTNTSGQRHVAFFKRGARGT